MKITINISIEDAKHLASPHTFYDECERGCIVLRKVQKEINKYLKNRTLRSVGVYKMPKSLTKVARGV